MRKNSNTLELVNLLLIRKYPNRHSSRHTIDCKGFALEKGTEMGVKMTQMNPKKCRKACRSLKDLNAT